MLPPSVSEMTLCLARAGWADPAALGKRLGECLQDHAARQCELGGEYLKPALNERGVCDPMGCTDVLSGHYF